MKNQKWLSTDAACRTREAVEKNVRVSPNIAIDPRSVVAGPIQNIYLNTFGTEEKKQITRWADSDFAHQVLKVSLVINCCLLLYVATR